MATNKYLRHLAEEYLEKGHSRGYTSEMLYEAIQDLVFGTENQKFEENGLEDEENEKIYQDLMVKALIKEKGMIAYKTPKSNIIRTAGILYVIHKKEYDDTEGFLKRIAEHEHIKVESAKGKLLSKDTGNLYLGIAMLLKDYASAEDWTRRNSFDQRRECLEKMERQLFEEIKDEYTKSSGCV